MEFLSGGIVKVMAPGLAVEYDPSRLATIRSIRFDPDRLKEALRRQQKNVEFYVDCADDYLAVEYDWSTGIDFGGYDGGGDFIVLVPDAGWNEDNPILSVAYEWNDTYMQQMGIPRESDSSVVMGILVDALVEFVSTI